MFVSDKITFFCYNEFVGMSMVTWFLLVPLLSLGQSCSSRQLPDDEMIFVNEPDQYSDKEVSAFKHFVRRDARDKYSNEELHSDNDDGDFTHPSNEKTRVKRGYVVDPDDDPEENDDEVIITTAKKKPTKKIVYLDKPDPPMKEIIVVGGEKSSSRDSVGKSLAKTNTKLDKTKAELEETVKLQSNLTQSYMYSATDNLNKRLDNIENILKDLKSGHEELRNISENVCSSGNLKNLLDLKMLGAKNIAGDDAEQQEDLKKLNEHVKYINDRDLLKNSVVSTKIKDPAAPYRKGNVITVNPMTLAQRLRSIVDKTPSMKRMVSVCYHNDPDPFYEKHPLAPNDGPEIQAVFNGTMDALHRPNEEEPNSPFNLDKPNYVNALLLEIKSLNKKFVSICLENETPDNDYTYPTQCINLAINRNNEKTP